MSTIKFSGLASGIDSASLIDALIEARETQNISRKNEIDHLESENDSLEELNTKILALNDLTERFRTINGGGVLKKGSSTNSSAVTASAGANAVNSSFAVTVTTLAKNGTASIERNVGDFSSATDYVSQLTEGSGTIAISAGTGAYTVGTAFTVTENVTTLQDLVDQINAYGDFSGRLTASIVNAGTSVSPNYKIALNTLYQGTDRGDIEVAIAGMTNTIDTESDATNAVFTVDGLGSITRTTNSVSDLFTGVTINLLQGGGASATITIGTDPDGTADLINQIFDQYNDIVEFINENDIVTQDTDSALGDIIYGSLAKTKVDNDFISQFKSTLLNASSSSGTYVQSIADMGISTNRDGTLSINLDTFKSRIASDPTGASEVLTDFADDAAGISGVLYQFTKFDGNIDIAQESNLATIENLNEKIAQVERGSDKLRESMERTFARLESLTGQLQSQQSALTGILAGLS